MSGDRVHGRGGGFSCGNAGEDSDLGGSERPRVADALHLRAEEIYSTVLERVAAGLDGGALSGKKPGGRAVTSDV